MSLTILSSNRVETLQAALARRLLESPLPDPFAPEVIVVPPKANLSFQKGDVIEIQPGGGGGYGLPAKRQPEARDEDLANGMVTPQSQQVAAE